MKKLLLILVGLVVAVLLVAAFLPKDFKIEKQITINRSKAEVFNYVKMMKNEKEWSPWSRKDPNMVQNFKGEDGTVGFVSSWSGNRDVGVGEQEIVAIVPGERIDLELRFTKPMKATNKAYFVTESVGENQTKLTWTMEGTTPFPFNLICYFMHKMVENDFAAGLDNIKNALEKK